MMLSPFNDRVRVCTCHGVARHVLDPNLDLSSVTRCFIGGENRSGHLGNPLDCVENALPSQTWDFQVILIFTR